MLLDALTEDRRASWVPDVLGWGDAEALIEDPEDRLDEIETMYYPKPDGTLMSVPLLGARNLARLHRVTDALRGRADESLAPGVCGYRRGAEVGLSYSRENLRFHEFSSAEADSVEFVAVADVAKFFEHAPWNLVLASAADLLPTAEERRDLERFASDAVASGLRYLPAGYADARLLGNLVLRRADAALGDRFTRWVDDYRIFTPTEEEARGQLDALRAALDIDGLKLNESKTRVMGAAEFTAGSGSSLQSVYHPDVESADQVRAALRSVFAAAAGDPVGQRRSIRFVLPRMANERDEIAVEWALRMLPTIPWEAPRLCAYLAAFAHRGDVAESIEAALLDAVTADNTWFATRLAALTTRTGISAATAEDLSAGLGRTSSAALWGLGVRALALSGHGVEVRRLIGQGIADQRAAAGALVDLGEQRAGGLVTGVAAATRDLLADGPAPLPELDAIL